MAEQFDLATPVVTTRNAISLVSITLNWPAQNINVQLIGSDGVGFAAVWSGASAVTLMTALNTANLSLKSLYKRVLEQAAADGKIPAGSVSGTPQ